MEVGRLIVFDNVIVSGVVPEEPVVSKKSGHLFEKRLVLKYIKEHGTCPITGQPLSEDDLIDVKSNTILFFK